MTKLYVEPDGTWAIPGGQSKAAARVDVPNRPGELAGWLNERRVGDVDRLADWIRDEASQGAVERLFEAMGTRFGEARRPN